MIPISAETEHVFIFSEKSLPEGLDREKFFNTLCKSREKYLHSDSIGKTVEWWRSMNIKVNTN